MVQSVFTIGVILTVVIVGLSLILSKASSKDKYTGYFPNIILAVAGFIFLFMAPLVEKVDIMGAGFGGWGIASLFSAAIGFIITSIVDSYANAKA